MKYTFEIVELNKDTWYRIENTIDSNIFVSEQWCNYLHTIGYTPLVITVSNDEGLIGYFIGTKKKIVFFTLVMAPADGTGTYTQGLVMLQQVYEDERVTIYQKLVKWLFQKHICVLFQVDDWQLRRDQEKWTSIWHQPTLDAHGLKYTYRETLYVNLNKTEEELWAGLQYKSAKYSVNKARKLGLYVREITDRSQIDEFVAVHYNQLVEVCQNKNGQFPKVSQQPSRMKAVCEALFPNRIMMLEVLGKDENGLEQIMSSGIYCYDKGESIYWTGASYKRYQKYCPNELMVWEAMRMLSQRGAGDLNFGGMAHYKLKFGTIYAYVPRLIIAKYAWLIGVKSCAKKMYFRFKDVRIFYKQK